MVIDLSKKSDRRAVFEKFALNTIKACLKKIDANDDIPLTEDERQRSFNALDLAMDLQEGWPDISSLLIVIAPKIERSEHRDEWIPFLHRGVQQSRGLEDTDKEGELGFFLGMLYLLSRRWELADSWFRSSINCFEILSDNHRMARSLNRLAHNAQLQQDYSQAKEYVKKTFSLLNQEDIEQEYNYFVLGNIAYGLSNFTEAEKYFRKSLNICRSQNNKYRIGQRFLDIGRAINAQGRFKDAMSYYQQSLVVLKEIKATVECAIVQMNQGIIYSNLGDSKRALDYYRMAKPVLYEVQDILNLAHLYTNQAVDYYHLQRWHEARYACQASIQYYEQLGLTIEVIEAIDGLGLIYLKSGQYNQSLDKFNEALERISSLNLVDDLRRKYLYNDIISHIQQVQERRNTL